MTITGTTSAIRDRRITTRYPIGEVTDGRETGTRFVDLTTAHNKERRTLFSRLTYIDVVVDRGYSIEKWGSDTPYAYVATQPVARYSDKALEAQHAEAVAQFEMGLVDKAVASVMLAQIREEVRL